jgi:tape measure domain-containing protein
MVAKARLDITATDKTRAAVESARRNFRNLDRSVKGTIGSLGVLAAGYGLSEFAKQVVQAGDEVRGMRARLDALGASATVFGDLVNLSKQMGVYLKDAGEVFTRFQLGASNVGITSDKVVELTTNLVRLGQIGGSSSQEMAAGLLQMSQGFAANNFQGQELKATLLTMPLVLQTLAKELGTTVDGLREMGARGEISAEKMLKINDAGDKIEETWRNLPVTFERAMQTVETEWQLTLNALDNYLAASETFKFFSEEIGSFLRKARALLGDTTDPTVAQGLVNDLLRQELELKERIESLEQRRDNANSGRARNALTRQLNEAKARLLTVRAQREQISLERVQQQQDQSAKAAAAAATAGGAGGGDVSTWREVESRMGQLGIVSRDGRNVMDIDVVWSLQTTKDGDKRGIVAIDKTLAAAYDKASERGEELTREEREWMERRNQQWVQGSEERVRAEKAAAQKLKAIQDQESQFAIQAARNMQDAFAQFLFDPFEDGIQGMLKGFVDILRQMVAQAAAAQIFQALGVGTFLAGGGIPFLQSGGPVTGGRPYIVGEAGPELFIPSGSGMVAPSGSFGNVVVNQNIDARGNSNPGELLSLMPMLADAIKREILDDRARGLI